MSLTYAEREACRRATFLHGPGHGYGSPAEGYCPIGAVALSRGVELVIEHNGEYGALEFRPDGQGRMQPWSSQNWHICEEAGVDVYTWAGFSSLREFLAALEAYGTAIFPPEIEGIEP